MRALAKVAALPGHVDLIEASAPTPSPGQVLVRVLACGLCGTDLTLYQWPEKLAAQLGIRFPIVFGHEFAGRVVEVGPGVQDPAVGNLVTVNPHLFCNQCHYCTSGREEICDSRPILGVHLPGGFAEFVTVRANNTYRLPNSVPPAVAALGEPLSVGLHVTARGDVRPGWTPVIIGAGPIGLLTGLGCQRAGAERVIVVGLPEDADRLAVARRLGIETFFANTPALQEAVTEATGGLGAEVVFEIAGNAMAMRQALGLCRKDGTVVTVGIPHEEIPIDVAAFTFAEKRLVGSRGYTSQNWRDAVSLMSERTDDLKMLVSDILPLDEFDAAFARLIARQGLKIILDPSASATSHQ